MNGYSAYKPSGVEWLGDVPAHWQVRRLRTVAEMRVSNVDKHTKEDELPVRLCNYVDVYKNDRITQAIPFMRATASRDEVKRFGLKRGDVLITKDSEAWDDIGVPALVEESSDDLLSGYHLALLRPFRTTLGAYLALALQSKGVAYQFHVGANGVTRYGLTHTTIQSVCLPLPPLPEQRDIVRYLDHVDERIRRYVSAREKLIALLEEERQAVIHRAVTRGLVPNVPLKPSGVEWLGDVPAHWEVRRLRTVASIRTGGRDTINRRDDGAYPFFVRSQTIERIDTWSYDGEAVLTAGDGVGVGKVFHYVNGKFDYHQRVYKFSNFSDVVGKFFFCYFRSMLRYEVLQGTAKSTVDSLRLPMLQNFPVALPPVPEQTAIVEHLDKATAGIDAAITRARRQIELLREYRTRLIADVVTGKLDVVSRDDRHPPRRDRSVRPIELDNNNDNAPECPRMPHFSNISSGLAAIATWSAPASTAPSARRRQTCRRTQFSGIQ